MSTPAEAFYQYLLMLELNKRQQVQNFHSLSNLQPTWGYVYMPYHQPTAMIQCIPLQHTNYSPLTPIQIHPQNMTIGDQQPSSESPNQIILPPPSRRVIMKNSEKQIESARKNAEFNILNQMMNCLDNGNYSRTVINKAIRNLPERGPLSQQDVDRLRTIVINIIRLINCRRGRKYVSCSIIAQYFTSEGFVKNVPSIQAKLQQTGLLSLKEFCLIFRILVYQFLRSNSVGALLTSWRIKNVGKQAHLQKRRDLLKRIARMSSE